MSLLVLQLPSLGTVMTLVGPECLFIVAVVPITFNFAVSAAAHVLWL